MVPKEITPSEKNQIHKCELTIQIIGKEVFQWRSESTGHRPRQWGMQLPSLARWALNLLKVLQCFFHVLGSSRSSLAQSPKPLRSHAWFPSCVLSSPRHPVLDPHRPIYRPLNAPYSHSSPPLQILFFCQMSPFPIISAYLQISVQNSSPLGSLWELPQLAERQLLFIPFNQ